ncbi:MAG: CHAT domain-containing protein [Oscillochloridaceae bacterium umkhey_bin13]
MSQFDDLLVRVLRRGSDGSYTVELWLQGGRRIGERVGLDLANFREPLGSQPEQVAAAGLDLFNRLFSGTLAVAFQQSWAAAIARNHGLRLRLALDASDSALHAIPWELMFFDDSGGMNPPRPLATESKIVFSRYIESGTFEEGRPIAERPIRMLIAVSSPTDLAQWDLAPLDKEADQRDFQTRFSAVIASGQFQADYLPVVSEEALHQALAEGSLQGEIRRGYDALLFYGHALYHERLGSRLVLEAADTGKTQLYDGDELIGFLGQLPATHRPALIVLVACNSAIAGQLNSLAARLLIESGIVAVIAMQRLVEITLARAFTNHLSDYLLRDGTIDLAINAARRRVFQPDDLGWSTPVLYMRNLQGTLFSPNAQLEYVEGILRNSVFVRWGGADFIETEVMAVAPGQDWQLLRQRPEDAPAAVGVIEALDRTLDLGLRPTRRRDEHRSLQRTNLAALIGPPQSGQTTVLRRLTYELASAVTQNVAHPLGLFVSALGYEVQRGQGRLERHLIEQARQSSPTLATALGDLFRQSTSPSPQPRFIFLIDNLDALPERARQDFARDLANLAATLPSERFLVTSAQDSFPQRLLARAQVFVLQPLSEHQVFSFLRQRNRNSASQIYNRIRENRLMSLARDPSLINLIYERLQSLQDGQLTRNQIVQDYLDRTLGVISPRFSLGDAARESLTELAWLSRSSHREALPLSELFGLLAQVRRERDYSLEELYDLLREARLLVGVGQQAARFVNPLLHAYCTALALLARRDMSERLRDIVALCANPERQAWWEDVLYALAGLLADPTPLLRLLAEAIRGGGDAQVLIAARCLEVLTPTQESRVVASLRAELLDACVLRLRSEREPNAERREQLVSALGRLRYHQVRHELRRILVEKVRLTPSGPRYEYTNVRIAAARALRNIYLTAEPEPAPEESSSTANLVLSNQRDEVSLTKVAPLDVARMPSLKEIRDDQMLVNLMRVWMQSNAGRPTFRSLLRESPSTPERALAAFALGDMADFDNQKLLDARHLLRIILSPGDDDDSRISAEWQDTMWAAADALTLFDPDQVAPLLTVLIRRKREIPDSAAQQLAYLAGRVRATERVVLDWLIELLVTNPSQSVKAKALQSLAWMGRGIPEMPLPRPDGRDGPTMKELTEAIAAAREIPALQIGTFALRFREADPPGSAQYLRRKAIEALAWIGDATTLRRMEGQVPTWPIDLREEWYRAAATIRRRTG